MTNASRCVMADAAMIASGSATPDFRRNLQQRIGDRFIAGFVASLGADAGSFGNDCYGAHVSTLWTTDDSKVGR